MSLPSSLLHCRWQGQSSWLLLLQSFHCWSWPGAGRPMGREAKMDMARAEEQEGRSEAAGVTLCRGVLVGAP